MTDNLVKLVKATEISIISEEIFDHDPFTRLQSLKVIILEPGHSISYKIACAPSEDSDQPAHLRSLI